MNVTRPVGVARSLSHVGRGEHLCAVRRAHGGGVGRRRRSSRIAADGVRRVEEIVAVPGRVENDVIEIEPVFVRRQGRLLRTKGLPPRRARFERAGIDVQALLNSGA